MADQASDAEEREKAYHMASAEGRLLYHIDEALTRLKEGTYGVCCACGKKISKPRLEVVPHARLCIECKKAEENGLSRTIAAGCSPGLSSGCSRPPSSSPLWIRR